MTWLKVGPISVFWKPPRNNVVRQTLEPFGNYKFFFQIPT